MKVLVAVFILLYAFLAVVLLAFSVHGPDVLPPFAGAYLVLSVSLLLITYLRLEKKGSKRKRLIVVAVGIALALCSGLVLAGAAAYEELERELQLARTQVSDVRDETLHTPAGNPVGIRVSYTIRFPHDGYYEVSPFMRPDEGFHRAVRDQVPARSYSDRPLQMRAAARTIEPFPVEANQGRMDARSLAQPNFGLWFEGDVAYQFTFELLPIYIRRTQAGGHCIAAQEDLRWHGPPEGYEALIQADAETRYEMWIHDTKYGALHGDKTLTENSYNPRVFYEGLMRESPARCGQADLADF